MLQNRVQSENAIHESTGLVSEWTNPFGSRRTEALEQFVQLLQGYQGAPGTGATEKPPEWGRFSLPERCYPIMERLSSLVNRRNYNDLCPKQASPIKFGLALSRAPGRTRGCGCSASPGSSGAAGASRPPAAAAGAARPPVARIFIDTL